MLSPKQALCDSFAERIFWRYALLCSKRADSLICQLTDFLLWREVEKWEKSCSNPLGHTGEFKVSLHLTHMVGLIGVIASEGLGLVLKYFFSTFPLKAHRVHLTTRCAMQYITNPDKKSTI